MTQRLSVKPVGARLAVPVLLAVLALVAPALWAAEQGAATPQGSAYKPDAGPHKVLTVGELVLHDDKRGKDLPLKIYYPDAAGPFPVIVWSHGAGGSKDGYAALGQHWASHGYVTIHPSHDDSLAVRWKKGERVTLTDTARSALTEPDRWVNRPKDISFILDGLAAIEEKAPALKGKMDTARIGVGGHSFGAYTTQVIGGATVDIPGQGKGLSFRDTRVRAVLMYSPQGIGQMGLTAESWKDFTLPAMMVTGSNDLSALGQGTQWRRAGFDSAPAGGKYWILIQGAHHFTFSDMASVPSSRAGGAGDVDPARHKLMFGWTEIGSIAFWDAYLKDDKAAKDYLASDALPTLSKGELTLERK